MCEINIAVSRAYQNTDVFFFHTMFRYIGTCIAFYKYGFSFLLTKVFKYTKRLLTVWDGSSKNKCIYCRCYMCSQCVFGVGIVVDPCLLISKNAYNKLMLVDNKVGFTSTGSCMTLISISKITLLSL